MTLLTQIEVEQRMYHGGIKRAENMMARAEGAGRAHQNPYAKDILREFVLPLAEVIRTDAEPTGQRGPRRAHIQLLAPLDADAVAFIAVRVALNACMDTRHPATDRTVGYKIGATVHSELVLAQIEKASPELYYTLTRDLARRLSKDERHRMTVMKMQAKQAGIEWVEWPIGAREQVGAYLLGLIVQAGLVELGERPPKAGVKVAPRPVTMSMGVMQRIDQIKSYVALTSPVYGPCVEPPLDWTTCFDGGFHTPELRRAHRSLVAVTGAARHLYRDIHMPVVLNAVNALQRTAWQVNERILDIVLACAEQGQGTEEIVSLIDPPKPPAPGWLAPDFDKETMTDEQRLTFKAWKREVAEWHTRKKLTGVRYARFYAATRAAEMFRGYPTLHFVYFADSRGRLYPLTYGVNPQGSDLQKALIRFSLGKPLHTEDALRWFHIHGANKFGYDKATLSERFMWAHSRREWLLHIAADPVNHTEWMEADSPLQFLAWVLEYAAWAEDPEGFVSHIPVSMDGSCNGLQNLSAMLRDEVGGQATNLTDNEVMEDIYRRVAEAALQRLRGARYEDTEHERLRLLWLEHGVSRSVVKRAVMTTPYGVTLKSATEYVIEDYLKHMANPFDRSDFRQAAKVLMDHAWPAIGDVVVKGRQAMDWLKACARSIIKNLKEEEEPIIHWVSPSGFPACQTYFEAEVHRIRTFLLGDEKIKVLSETDTPDRNKHASGLAPNFVHSMDAAHLHRVASAARSAMIDALAMIHDDYGTHAADSQKLYDIIRQEFVSMYEFNDPIADFAKRYPCVPPPPEKGCLDIQEVLRSKFFFS